MFLRKPAQQDLQAGVDKSNKMQSLNLVNQIMWQKTMKDHCQNTKEQKAAC